MSTTEPDAPAAGARATTGAVGVPWGLEVAAAWSWRLLLVGGGLLALLWLMAFFAVLSVPLAIALLIAALASPATQLLRRWRVPRALAAGLVVLAGLAAVSALLTFVGQQIAQDAQDLADSVATGLGQIRTWLKDGPLQASDSQIDGWIAETQRMITDRTRDGQVVTQLTSLGAALGNVLAGFFIVLFAVFFFLADGERIWRWCLRVVPRAARAGLDGSGRVAWASLTQFVRATVLVALVDAIGVVVVAALLGVPLVFALGVLVFLGAFVPLVGATVAGGVAVLVALVDGGPVVALLMLGGVLLVQQIEGQVLQPFLLGRFVAVHPLAVILAIGAGVIAGGVVGALVAVPLVAAGNAVAVHLAGDPSGGGMPGDPGDGQGLGDDPPPGVDDPDVDPGQDPDEVPDDDPDERPEETPDEHPEETPDEDRAEEER